MNQRARSLLERHFGATSVFAARPRFDAAEVPAVAPVDERGFLDALSIARREGWCVVPFGCGSKLSWCRAAPRVDFMISTSAWRGVIAYEPGDGTLTARSGSTMAELADVVAAGGHALSPDVPRPRRATLGGVIAAGQSGLDRTRRGALREHVLGLEVALANGTRARCGGRLVKNVTGYDLQRLFTGSHGTLCVILEATLRLFPAADEFCVLTLERRTREELLTALDAIARAPLQPWFVVCARRAATADAEWQCALAIGGRREPAEAELTLALRLWPGAQLARGEAARAEAAQWRDSAFDEGDGPSLSIEAPRADFARTLELVELTVEPCGAVRWRCEPAVARIDVCFVDLLEPERLTRTLFDLRQALAPLQGRVRLRHAREAATVGAADPLGAPSSGLELMHAIRRRLDPAQVFAAGRLLEAR